MADEAAQAKKNKVGWWAEAALCLPSSYGPMGSVVITQKVYSTAASFMQRDSTSLALYTRGRALAFSRRVSSSSWESELFVACRQVHPEPLHRTIMSDTQPAASSGNSQPVTSSPGGSAFANVPFT